MLRLVVGTRSHPRFLTSRHFLTRCFHSPHIPFSNANGFLSSSSTRSTITKLLSHISSRREVEQYLKFYSSIDKPKFAVIKVGGGILEDEMDTLVESLGFLWDVGLLPVVLHGAGPQLNARLKHQNIVSDYQNGLRVTTPQILRTAIQTFREANLSLVQSLERIGTRARPIQCGVFEARFLNKEELGYVGQVVAVHPSAVYAALDARQIPVLTCMGETRDGQVLNVNADVAAQELAKCMRPVKIIYLSSNGGISDDKGNLITAIDLETDYDRLMNQTWFKHGNKLKLREIKTLLDELPTSSSVAITSARNLPKELFTHKGSGTLVRRSERINSHSSLVEINTFKLKHLIEESFEARLVSNYFEILKPKLSKIYLSAEYRAVAIVTNDLIPYLDKFAVAKLSQSEGTGMALWKILINNHKKLYWRSRSDNPINSWYFDRAQGSVTKGEWTVFWLGLENPTDFELIEKLVESALKKPYTIDRSLAPENVLVNGNSKPFSNAKSSNILNQNLSKRPFSTARSRINIPKFTQKRSFSTRSTAQKLNVALIGARGYTGVELLKLLANHKSLQLRIASSRALVGKKIKEVVSSISADFAELEFVNLRPSELPEDVDVWVLALPNNLSEPWIKSIRSKSDKLIIDLSADHRFDSGWTYGLPERQNAREIIKKASQIANPGCYATGAQISLLPLKDLIDFDYTPTVFGVSGYSGAGTTKSRKNDLNLLKDNLMPYSLVNHIHEREMTRQIGFDLRFMPHVASWFRGIQLTTAVQLHSTNLKQEDIIDKFNLYYQNEPLVKIVREIPEVRQIANTHHVCVGGFVLDEKNGRLVVCSTIDNLLKGAATQCLQNINLACGLEELEGIDYRPGLQKSVIAD